MAVPGAPVARGQGLSGMDLALHPDFERNHYVYISYSKPLDEKRKRERRRTLDGPECQRLCLHRGECLVQALDVELLSQHFLLRLRQLLVLGIVIEEYVVEMP